MTSHALPVVLSAHAAVHVLREELHLPLYYAAEFHFCLQHCLPLYLLARRMLNREHSLILILVSSLIPFNFLIPNRLLSENLYFPLLLWSLYFAFVSPADTRQRLAWDALTGFTFGLLYLTRFISLAVIPFLMVIWWIKPFENVSGIFQWNWKKVANALMMVLITALVFSPWVYIGLNNGLSLKETLGFGIAATTNPQQLTLVNS
jgi:hypothetical protein